VATWLTALAIGMAGFFTGSRPGLYEVIAFGLAFGVASAVAGVAALAVGGRGRLAIEAALAIITSVLLVASVVVTMLWLLPVTTQYAFGIGSQEIRFYRLQLVAIVRDFARPRFPTALALGLAAGSVAGFLVRLGRRRRGLAMGLGVGLLVAVAASSSAVARLAADFVLDARKEGGNWAVSSLNPIEVAGTIGAVAGSMIGALAACGAMRGSRGGQATAAPMPADGPTTT
jgi:hypothetical protein